MSKKTIGAYMRMMMNVEQSPTDDSDEDDKKEVIESRPVIKGRSVFQSENEKFLKFTQDKLNRLSNLVDKDINEIIESDGYTLTEYLIVGITLEQGLIVILNCSKDNEDHYFHIEISDTGILFKGNA